MKAKVATCENCGAALGCEPGSAEDLRYWRTQDATLVCNECLLKGERDSGDGSKLYALRVRANRGINLDTIEATCTSAEGSIVQWQIDLVREAVTDAVGRHHHDGERIAALDAGQTAWERACSLNAALEEQVDVMTGRRAKRQRTAAGFSSGEERRSERQPEWDKWQAAINEIHQKNPALKKSPAQERVGRQFGVSRPSVAKHTTWPGES